MIDADKIRVMPKTDDAAVAPGLLEHMSDLKHFVIADRTPDIRGWEVELRDRQTVGVVTDLIVDTTDLSARYLEIKTYHDAVGTDDDQWVLVPVQCARINEREQRVIIDRLPATGLAAAPHFASRPPTKSQEQEIQEYFGIDIMAQLIRDELPAGGDQSII
jgi:hypothetical protein